MTDKEILSKLNDVNRELAMIITRGDFRLHRNLNESLIFLLPIVANWVPHHERDQWSVLAREAVHMRDGRSTPEEYEEFFNYLYRVGTEKFNEWNKTETEVEVQTA